LYSEYAWLCVFLFGIGVIFWARGVSHIGWHPSKELTAKHTEMIAKQIAEEMGTLLVRW
jgi:hypothetical protein